jgi:hypothetical protein
MSAHVLSMTVVPRELQQLWLSLMRGTWSSIAVVPADPGTSSREVTSALSDIALLHDLTPFKVFDANNASIADAERIARERAAAIAEGMRTVTAVDSLLSSLSAVSLVMAADAVLLVVRLGASEQASLHSTIDMIGRERILGCVALPAADR